MNRIGYIFVDDGSPEASDYDNNYVGYDLAETGSYERAVEEAKGRRSIAPPPAACTECLARRSVSGVTRDMIAPSTAGRLKGNGISAVVTTAQGLLSHRPRVLVGTTP